ncbi:hypothetical protein MARHY1218 [Marinobacter nauticus ATCC 49840]|nr:hypothetical protein MARHY1218 [Marinobacter nauticus ATCC 49840]
MPDLAGFARLSSYIRAYQATYAQLYQKLATPNIKSHCHQDMHMDAGPGADQGERYDVRATGLSPHAPCPLASVR